MAKLPILIVDDDDTTCKLMAKLLAVLGYETDTALDGPSALKLFGQRKYGLAISDYQMPGMNGIELFKRLRELSGTLAGILVTGMPVADIEAGAIDAGMRQVMPKPANLRQLIPIIEDELAKAETPFA
jgi:CheY-like chemotaxis protein